MMKVLAWLLLAAIVTVVVYLTWHLLVLVRAERASEWVYEKATQFTAHVEEKTESVE